MTKRTYSIRQIIAIRSKVAGKTSSTPAASAPKTEREAKPYSVTVVAAEERNRNTDGAGFTALRVKVDGWKVRDDLWTGATVDGVGHGLQPGMRSGSWAT